MSSLAERLGAYGRLNDADLPLSDAALDLAQWAEPQLNLAPYQRHLEMLSADVRAYIGPDTQDTALVLEAARQILARRYGYAEIHDAEERADAANLVRTIDRRRGTPTALVILYAHVLAPYIQALEFIDFSDRTLVGVPGRGERFLIDPLSGGRPVSARDLRRLVQIEGDDPEAAQDLSPFGFSPLQPRQILVRLQDDVKAHHLRRAQPEAAIQALEGALLIAPQDARLWRELGVLHARLEHFMDASRALKRFLALPGSDAERYTASQLLQELSQRIKKGET